MNKPPAFQIYARDEITDYPGLSAAARGVFLLLRCRCWLLGSIPTSPGELARLSLVSLREFRKVWPEIRSNFKKRGASYICPKLKAQRDEQIGRHGVNSRNGELGAKVRWGPFAVVKPEKRYNTRLIYTLADQEFFRFLESGTRPDKDDLFKATTRELQKHDIPHTTQLLDEAIVSVFRQHRKRQSK